MNNSYSDIIVEEIRNNNNIEDVVSEYTKLEKKGKYFFGLCPFHNEKTASFSITPSKQMFYCYSCGKGGNVFNFIMNVENLSYVETLKFLATRAKIELPDGDSQEEKEKAKQKQEIIKINTESARFFFDILNSSQGEKGRLYLRNRKINEKTVKKFGLGYSPENWDSLNKYLLQKDFKEEDIINSGLVIPNKKGGYFDRFRGRIMFPILDIRGNIIGFGGRVIDSSMPKYMNSPETLVYTKGKNLYALNFVKNTEHKKIVVVEGYMDTISLYQSGITNVVASLGTALTDNQARLLKKYFEEIIISYDSDNAGQLATMKGLDLLSYIGCSVKVLTIEDGKDPDDYIKIHGSKKFEKLINSSISLIEYKTKVLKTQINTDTTEGKINFLNKIASLLANINNNIEMEMYIKKIAKEYEISEESLFTEIARKIKPKATIKSIFEKKDLINKNDNKNISKKNASLACDINIAYYEKILLAILCENNSIYTDIKEKININYFSNEENIEIAKIVLEKIVGNKGIVSGELFNLLNEENAKIFAQIFQVECNFEDYKKAALDIIKNIDFQKLDKREKEILRILSFEEEFTEKESSELKQELKKILIQKKNL